MGDGHCVSVGLLWKRYHNSCPSMVPVPLASLDGCRVALEAVLEKVEDGKLISGHNICVGLCFNLAPDLRQGHIQDLANSWIRSTIWALSGNLQSLGNGGILLGLVLLSSRRPGGVVVAATHAGIAERRVWLAMRHRVDGWRVLEMLLILVCGRMDRQHRTERLMSVGWGCGHIYSRRRGSTSSWRSRTGTSVTGVWPGYITQLQRVNSGCSTSRTGTRGNVRDGASCESWRDCRCKFLQECRWTIRLWAREGDPCLEGHTLLAER